MSLYKLYSLCNEIIYPRTIVLVLDSWLHQGAPTGKIWARNSPPSCTIFFIKGFGYIRQVQPFSVIMITNWFCMLSKATIILPIVISHTCYIPIFCFKLCPKFPLLFHTPTFLTLSYSILWHFWQFLTISILQHFPIPHSDISNISCSLPMSFHTPMFSLPRHFWNPFHSKSMLRHFPMFSLFL